MRWLRWRRDIFRFHWDLDKDTPLRGDPSLSRLIPTANYWFLLFLNFVPVPNLDKN
jgi:hypothetical protein